MCLPKNIYISFNRKLEEMTNKNGKNKRIAKKVKDKKKVEKNENHKNRK